MSKKLIISEEEKKYLMSLYSNKDIINEVETGTASGTDAPTPRQNLVQPDAGTWNLQKAIDKWPCLNNLAVKPKTILNNGSYDYIKIVWEGLPFNAFLGDGHLYQESSKSFTGKYLGKDVPCKGESINNKLDSQASKENPSSNKYIDQLAKQLQLPGKSEQEKINQIMAELNKITPKTATA